jgi:hypothetical protein
MSPEFLGRIPDLFRRPPEFFRKTPQSLRNSSALKGKERKGIRKGRRLLAASARPIRDSHDSWPGFTGGA